MALDKHLAILHLIFSFSKPHLLVPFTGFRGTSSAHKEDRRSQQAAGEKTLKELKLQRQEVEDSVG